MRFSRSLSLSLVVCVVVCLMFSSVAYAAIPEDFEQFVSAIPDVTVDMLYPDFWIENTDGAKKPIMNEEQIAEYNLRNVQECAPIKDLENYQESFTRDELAALITALSKAPRGSRYNSSGVKLTADYFAVQTANLNLAGLADANPVRFGIAVKRTEMRTFPTADRIYTSSTNRESDQWMETAVYPAEPLVILSTSADGQWYFAQMYNYRAWIPAADVGLTTKEALFSYVHREPFLVVTGAKVFTQYSTVNPGISEIQLDMGVRIPLCTAEEIADKADGRFPASNLVVLLPIRNANGTASFVQALISRFADLNIGYLKYTKENIFTQAFKFEGERYGWGGTHNSRDCSGFLMDVFRTMNVRLPRNSGEQGGMAVGVYYPIPSTGTIEEKLAVLDQMEPGSMIWMSGHVMLYLGKYEGEHFMIHDSGYASGVAVTPCSIYSSFYGTRQYILPDLDKGNNGKHLGQIKNGGGPE